MVMLGKEYDDVYVVSADITPTARLKNFQNTYPDRLLNVGIAEQNMIDFTAGLAKEGLAPYAITLAAFVPMRCAEQMRAVLGYMHLNAKVIGIEAGVRFGPLGNTHYSMDDVAVTRAIPNFTVIAPSDPRQIYKAIFAAYEHKGPVYIRLTGAPGFPVLYPHDFEFAIGKAIEYRPGKEIALIASGAVLSVAIGAADRLEKSGISACVIDMHTIKPLDTNMLDKVFAQNRLVITIEEHSVIGGLGGAVAEYKTSLPHAPKHLICGLADSFKKVGGYEYQLRNDGLTPDAIAELALAHF